MPAPATIDVLVLANSADERRTAMTLECLETLRDQRSPRTIRVFVAESADAIEKPAARYAAAFAHSGERRTCRVLRSPKPFNFNRTVQAGLEWMDRFPAPGAAESRAALISNNDVTYAPDCLERLAEALADVDSVSPWMPGYHQHFHGPAPLAPERIVGHRVREHVAGWSYAFHRRILGRTAWLTPERMFPAELEFYYQDDFYGDVLEANGASHALIRDAHAWHLDSGSFDLLPDRNIVTPTMQPTYQRLSQELRGPSRPPFWRRVAARLGCI